MTYIILPKNSTTILPKNIRYSEEYKEIYLSQSVYISLSRNKVLIENYIDKWDTVKKIINTYEYIHKYTYLIYPRIYICTM